MTDRIRLECDENKGNMLLRNVGSTTHFYKLHTHTLSSTGSTEILIRCKKTRIKGEHIFKIYSYFKLLKPNGY